MNDLKMKILVVDDFATMRRIVKSILRQLGFENVDEAEDGQQAFTKLKTGNYQFLVTDWNMPNLDGLGLLQKIRSDNDLCKLPVLMVTAEADKEKVMEAIKSGVNNYIVKPFTAEVMKEKMERIFRSIAK